MLVLNPQWIPSAAGQLPFAAMGRKRLRLGGFENFPLGLLFAKKFHVALRGKEAEWE